MFMSPHTTTDSLDSGKASCSDCWMRIHSAWSHIRGEWNTIVLIYVCTEHKKCIYYCPLPVYSSFGTPPGHEAVLEGSIRWVFHSFTHSSRSFWTISVTQNLNRHWFSWLPLKCPGSLRWTNSSIQNWALQKWERTFLEIQFSLFTLQHIAWRHFSHFYQIIHRFQSVLWRTHFLSNMIACMWRPENVEYCAKVYLFQQFD